jgi:hypothetical protein
VRRGKTGTLRAAQVRPPGAASPFLTPLFLSYLGRIHTLVAVIHDQIGRLVEAAEGALRGEGDRRKEAGVEVERLRKERAARQVGALSPYSLPL